ncbi:MAG TPA: hypothetical protein VMF69_16765 [Gemmataceae bacterium]|nr:hypothetical protein [Gemmataceae bacterium]
MGAVLVVFQGPPAQGRPAPLPVRDDEAEIVWLFPATSAASWERFVAAVRRTAERLRPSRPDVQADDKSAFPQQTTAVPEVSLSASGSEPRFVFRWYKLTGDWKTSDWIAALLSRQPPPLAIIGGSSSDSARELASYLRRFSEELHLPAEDRPLLLLTAATADRVLDYSESEADQPASAEVDAVPLTQFYPERTFRFCFTNKQMAAAVSDFIWWRDDLRPTRDPVYMAMWNDDSYSRDLIDGFGGALRQVMARDVANQWTWLVNQFVYNFPPGLAGGIIPEQRLPTDPNEERSASTFCLEKPPAPHRIDSSVGSFDTPNPYEAKAAGAMLDALLFQSQSRPLLIVGGQVQPSRRFLRGLVRGMPSLSKRVQIVVATGDAIAFNTVYRDRQVSWNIQDLPFPLVFFCHRNPIDAGAGFRAGDAWTSQKRKRRHEDLSLTLPARPSDERDSTAETGTEDMLLFGDIVEALVQTGAPLEGSPCANATELAERLGEARLEDERIVLGGAGVPLFDREGQRHSGTGEHVVCLQPMWNEDFKDRLLPCATIEVWEWQRRDWERGERGQHWQRRGEPLTVRYSDSH